MPRRTPPPHGHLVPLKDAADLVGRLMCRETLRQLVLAGALRGRKIGANWFAHRADVQRLVEDENFGRRARLRLRRFQSNRRHTHA